MTIQMRMSGAISQYMATLDFKQTDPDVRTDSRFQSHNQTNCLGSRLDQGVNEGR